MKYQGNAREIAEQIINTFKSGDIIKPLSQVFFQNPDLPSSKYSAGNKLLISLTAMFRGKTYSGAGGFKFWQEKNRHVLKGEKAIHILAPLTGKREEEDDKGQRKVVTYIYGFRSVAVFAYEQTSGEDLPGMDDGREEFIRNLPFREVAASWGLTVTVDTSTSALGYYSPSGKKIGLNTRNLSTWCHELCHASDDRLNKLSFGQNREQEAIAELGGAVLLSMIGEDYAADIGGAWQYIKAYSENDDDAISLVMSILDRTSRAVQLIIDTAIAYEQKTLVIA